MLNQCLHKHIHNVYLLKYYNDSLYESKSFSLFYLRSLVSFPTFRILASEILEREAAEDSLRQAKEGLPIRYRTSDYLSK